MNITSNVKKIIKLKVPGQVFSYTDIPAFKDEPQAVVKTMSRLLKAGEIKRISKGQFYRPKQGILSELKPSDTELLKTLLYKDGKLTGYITGLALYNELGLTTQVPRIITIATEGARQKKDFGTIRAKLIESTAPITRSNLRLLQYLDVLKTIDKIPDTNINNSLYKMSVLFKKLNNKQIFNIKKIVTKYYKPRVIALTGLILETNGQDNAGDLKASLNPLSQYKIGLDKKQWPEMGKWNIK